MSRRRKIFYLITVVSLFVVLILPATGWLARLQLLPTYPASVGFPPEFIGLNYLIDTAKYGMGDDATLDHAARQTPDDFSLQYAAADFVPGKIDRFDVLDKVRKRFPDKCLIHATLLEILCRDLVKISRREGDSLSTPSATPPRIEEPTHPIILAKFEEIAAEGEAHDPTNGFFPAMRAVGYFAGHKDAEAMAAWKRAAEKPTWQDYSREERAAKIKLLGAANGVNEIGYLLRASVWQSAGEEDYLYERLRSATRIVIAKAVDAELAGDPEAGVALRRLTRQIGELIQQSNGSTWFHNYGGSINDAGTTIIKIALARPGGAPTVRIPQTTSEKTEQFHREKIKAAISYLEKIGHAEEAVAFTTAINRHQEIENTIQQGRSKAYYGNSDKAFALFTCWFVSILMITGFLFSLLFAGIFGLVYRFSPRLQKGEELQASARWGVILGIGVPTLVVLAVALVGAFSALGYVAAVIGGLILLVGMPLWFRLSLNQIGHGINVAFTTLWAIMAMAMIWVFTGRFFFPQVQAMLSVWDFFSASNNRLDLLSGTPGMLLHSVTILVPLLLIALFALCSRILRIPVAAGITRGMRAMAVPLACLFVFGYITCLFVTLRHEKAAITEMKRMEAVGELQAYTEIGPSR